LLGRGVLDDEAECAGPHGSAQIARPTEHGQDDHPAGRHLLGERRGGSQPVQAGHLDVEQRDVDLRRLSRDHDLVTAADLCDHVEVVLEFEQCR
jgi:hypothetical protein